MYKSTFCFTPSNIISVYLFLSLSLSAILLYPISIIPDAGGKSRIYEVGIDYTSIIKNSTYENSSLGIRIEHPANWKPFEKTSATTNASVIEFVPLVESEHDPLTPFFSISIENLKEVKVSQKLQDESPSIRGPDNDSTLEVLTERNLELAKFLPDFNIIELNRTSILSDSPAYKIVYTFVDPGSPLHPVFKSLNIWTVKEDKAYTISYTAPESEFSNHMNSIQNMIDSFVIGNNN
jgi:hypothetical protein